jgi:bifunctional DNA-binding transcriptional regulator/antitoxin component of YhaV-PrlF toxin-antitoxin module
MKIEHIHKIRRLGKYSYGISFPKEMMKNFGWKEKQKLVLVFDDKKKQILIKDWVGK